MVLFLPQTFYITDSDWHEDQNWVRRAPKRHPGLRSWHVTIPDDKFRICRRETQSEKEEWVQPTPPPSKEAGRQRRETSSYDLLPSEAPSPLDLLLWTAKVKTVKDVERSSKRFFKKLMTATNVPRIVYVSWKDFAGSCKVWVQI